MDSTRATDPLKPALAMAILAVVAAGVLADLAFHLGGAPASLVRLFSLSDEQNVPTWFATCLLFACSERLFAVGRRAIRDRDAFARHWIALAGIFAYLSLDEAIELHEHLGTLFEGHGVLYFSWVVPAALLVTLVGFALRRFLVQLPRDLRRRFVVAGAIYVTGALLMELPLGLFTERHGDQNLGYALLDALEESLELVGAGLFLLALRAHLASDLDAAAMADPATHAGVARAEGEGA